MKFAANILLLVTLVAASQANPTSNFAKANIQNNLSKYLLNPNDITVSDDPQVTAECFNKYLPEISAIASTFSSDYQTCITVADTQTTNLNNQAAANRTQFIQDSQDVCTTFQSCDNDTDTLSFFNCYSSVSGQEVSMMYELSNNASVAGNTLSQGLKSVQDTKDTCTSNADHTYVTSTANTYDLLNACFKNGLTDSSTTEGSTTTDAASTDSAATDADTTDAATTDAASTLVPAITTVAPVV